MCKGKKTPGRRTRSAEQPSCPHPECDGTGNALGNGTTHSSLDECPLHIPPTTSRSKRKRESSVRISESAVPDPPPKKTRVYALKETSATPQPANTPAQRKSTPRVKLVLSNKDKEKAKAKAALSEEEKAKALLPFGGKLIGEDADTSRCTPAATDRTRFRNARLKAEVRTALKHF